MRTALGLAVLLAGVSAAADLSALGYLDVTAPPYHADPAGVTNATAALQAAINAARDAKRACFFPPGTYVITGTLFCAQSSGPCVLVGSTINSSARATIHLADSSPGFQNPADRRVVVYFYNGSPGSEANTTHYDQGLIGIDISVGAGNDGAVGLRLQGAEGTTIQDTTIDLRAGGHTGIWGVPGSGGSTHNVTILGGVIGIDTRRYTAANSTGTQPTPTLTGVTLIDQTDKAAYLRTRGACIGVGWTISTALTGPVIHLQRNHSGEPFDGSFGLVDAQIIYSNASPANTVLEMGDSYSRSFFFDNVYVYRGQQVWTNAAPANPAGWMRFKRLAAAVTPQSVDVTGVVRAISEDIMCAGTNAGRLLCQSELNAAPPADLQSRHGWGINFPSFETPGIVNVKQFGAIGNGTNDDTAAFRMAIASNDVVFVPRGLYLLTDTVTLRPATKLIGVHHKFSRLIARENTSVRFGSNTAPNTVAIPMLRTADNPTAETVVAFLGVHMTFPIAAHNPSAIGHYAIEWRCGRHAIARMLDIQPYRQAGYYPSLVPPFYGTNFVPDCNYPERGHTLELFCTTHPLVQLRGNGGGKWFNVFIHGGHMFREDCRVILAEDTVEPVHFYHVHLQQQESAYHAEFRNARNVSIYGIKSELKAGILKFSNCDNIRVIGSGGLGTPDAGFRYEHLFLFTNCANFLIANIGEDIQPSTSIWIGVCYYRWINATLGTYQGAVEERADGTRILPGPFTRPILYLRGDPGYVIPESHGIFIVLSALCALLARRTTF